MRWPARRQRAFTLIELAIILAIIGLVVSATLVARELLHATKVKALAREFDDVRTAISGYQDVYRALPGDDRRADVSLPGANVAPGAGTGNGMIDGEWDSTNPQDESYLFWQHVRLAKLMAGPSDIAAANFRPLNALLGSFGVSSASASQIRIAGLRGSFQTCSAGIPGRLAKQLVIQMGEGAYASGAVRVVADDAPRGAPAVSLDAVQGEHTYTICQAF